MKTGGPLLTSCLQHLKYFSQSTFQKTLIFFFFHFDTSYTSTVNSISTHIIIFALIFIIIIIIISINNNKHTRRWAIELKISPDIKNGLQFAPAQREREREKETSEKEEEIKQKILFFLVRRQILFLFKWTLLIFSAISKSAAAAVVPLERFHFSTKKSCANIQRTLSLFVPFLFLPLISCASTILSKSSFFVFTRLLVINCATKRGKEGKRGGGRKPISLSLPLVRFFSSSSLSCQHRRRRRRR